MGHARQNSQRVLEKNFWELTRTVTYHKVIILRVSERKFVKNYLGNKSISLRKAFQAPFVRIQNEFQCLHELFYRQQKPALPWISM